jgi:DNA-binding winged helix-turn-helix (wHTH) protein/tetratricopeptide (TPR) repeat protein
MAFSAQELQSGFWIGDCRVEPRHNRITRGESEARVERRVMDVLVCLAEHAGEVVSRDTLTGKVWGNVVVTDQALTNCISELRHHLGDDRTLHRVIDTVPKRGYCLIAPVRLTSTGPPANHGDPAVSIPRSGRGVRWPLVAGLLLLAAVGIGFAWWLQRTPVSAVTSVAVMHFENAAADASLDYLGLALPDEIATLLTKARGIAVRPLGHAQDVDHVVSGRYYLETDGRLGLAIEAQNVRQNRVIWRARISAPAADLLTMRGRLADHLRQGLLPALGVHGVDTWGTAPAHDEAYQLYLRALALPQQPKLTERAIEMLERAVALEPGFAQAWHALGLRYYDVGTWFTAASTARDRSLAAHQRALELDPDLISAARGVVTHRTEAGDLAAAYGEARKLLQHFGPGADTHFAMSYVLRYGGMLEDAQRHCELALALDSKDPRLRSCAYSFLYAGDLDRVMTYLALDEGSFFVQWGTVLYHLRRDDRAAALRVTRQAAEEPTRGLMEPCLAGESGAALDGVAATFIEHWQRSGDPEAAYALAPMLAYCGRPQDALRFIDRAVERGFCTFPAMDLDPIWTPMRGDPEFQRLRDKGIACFEKFRHAIDRIDSVSP